MEHIHELDLKTGRFTFPATDKAGMIVDMDYSIQHQTNLDMALEVVSDTELRGWKMTEYWAFDQQIYFYAKFIWLIESLT